MLDALVLNIGRRIPYHPGWLAKKGRRGSYPLLPRPRLPASQRLSPTVKAPLLPPLFPNTLPKKLQFVFLWGGFCHGYQTLPPPHKRGKKGISYLRGKSLSISSSCQLFSATVGYLTLLSMWDRGGCLHFRTNEINLFKGTDKQKILHWPLFCHRGRCEASDFVRNSYKFPYPRRVFLVPTALMRHPQL